MQTHHQIDQRSMLLARAIVAKIDGGDQHASLRRARAVNQRWQKQTPSALHEQWASILQKDWSFIRNVLLDESELGARLRQNNPFCGVISPHERWQIYRDFKSES